MAYWRSCKLQFLVSEPNHLSEGRGILVGWERVKVTRSPFHNINNHIDISVLPQFRELLMNLQCPRIDTCDAAHRDCVKKKIRDPKIPIQQSLRNNWPPSHDSRVRVPSFLGSTATTPSAPSHVHKSVSQYVFMISILCVVEWYMHHCCVKGGRRPKRLHGSTVKIRSIVFVTVLRLGHARVNRRVNHVVI